MADDITYLKLVELMLFEWNSKEDDECFHNLQKIESVFKESAARFFDNYN